MSTNLPHIMSKVLNRPLLMEPGYARTFLAGLASRAGIAQVRDADGIIEGGEKLRVRAGSYSPSRDRERPYRVEDGIAVLPVDGTLVNKFGYMRPMSGMTGYDGILARAQDAFYDPEIKGILLDNDTPGGDVAGCFDCVKSLRQMADDTGKPLWALAYDMNASAGMALASAADRRLITSTGKAGSIGVIMAHHSWEKYLEEEGIDVTLIFAGAHKADGNPYENLPEEVYQRFLAETKSLREEFAQLVASNIGMPLEKVLATEALCYRGQDAVSAGLADEVVNGNDAIQIFSEHLSSQGRITSIGVSMSEEDNKTQASDSQAPAGTAEEQAGQSTAEQSDVTAKAKAEERERISAILNSEEAQGREALANHFATKTDMSADVAIASLKAAPKEQAAMPATKSALDMAMAEEGGDDIGADVETGDAEASEADRAVALFNEQHGIS